MLARVRILLREHRGEVIRFAKFATVGLAGAFTDFSLLNILLYSTTYGLVMANMFSFTAAVVQNFFLNRHWTFPESRALPLRSQLAKFMAVSLVGMGINTLVLSLVHALFLPFWRAVTSEMANADAVANALSINFAKVAATGVVLFWNFAANRFITYRDIVVAVEKD